MLRLDEVNGEAPEKALKRPRFEDLTPLFPDERLKLEREQVNLDRKRVDAALAEEFVQTDVSVDDLRQALEPRLQTDANMQTVIAKELYEIAAVLDAEQREEFAHLLRTGVLKF